VAITTYSRREDQDERPEDPFDGGRPMTILEHLNELRSRLIWCCIALVVALIISSIFTNDFLLFLQEPVKKEAPDAEIINNKVLGNFATYFKVSLLGALIISMPVLVYQTLMFVLPGLTPSEKKWVLPIVVGIFLSFFAGVAFAYYITLPRAVGFLLNFNKETARNFITIQDYIDFCTRLVFWIGVTFEMPIFVLALARFGLITGRKLLSWWRYMIVVVFVVAAVVTPTPDPITQTFVAGPMLVLYAAGVILAFIFGRDRRNPR
jgi:sec-independent protein translocase protein TatC